jgi:uncharacterized membrane protein YdjX (TVP38/TMEM64 family)
LTPETSPGSETDIGQASVWKRVLLLILLVVGLAVLARSDALHSRLLQFLTIVEAIIEEHPVVGVSVFVGASALSAILAFFSSAIIVPAAVHAWGAPLTMFLLWIGWTVGGMGTYAVGRWLGRPVVKAMISDSTLDQFEHRITTRAPFGLVLLFQFALPSEVPGSVLGLVRYSFAKYMAALTVTELPYAIGTVYLGESFLEQRTFLIVGIGAAGAIVSAWALLRLRKRLSG